MIGRRTVIGLTALCALLVSAFAAQSASAATTAYTCKKVTPAVNTVGFSKAHCKNEDKVSTNANYEHVSFGPKTTTEIIGSDTNTKEEHTGAILKATVAGSAIELVAGEVSGSGSMENSEIAEMIASGEGKIKYSKVTEKKLGCKVVGLPGGAEVVETKQLAASTAGVGEGLKFTPKEGTTFAEFELKECVVANTYKVIGSVLGKPDGATTNTTHNKITEEKTLRLQSAVGPVAGIEGTLTISGRDPALKETVYTPLSVT
jgi:hypothetical protein